MVKIKTIPFRDLLDEHQNIIYYLINKLEIRDYEGEFYQEGVIALWTAAETYQENRGKFSSYAYFLIEKALLSLIRKRVRQKQNEQDYVQWVSKEADLSTNLNLTLDPYLLQEINHSLSANQLIWFRSFVLDDLSVNEIAEREHVTVDAVKNWARLAKPKIKKLIRGV